MSDFVKNFDGQFSLSGKRFRFIGANVYELANVPADITKSIIDAAAGQGFNALRFWLFENRSQKEQIKKLNEICDLVNPYGLKLIVSLADKWGYLQNYRIDNKWYVGAYKKGYIDYIKGITGACKNRDEIMIWELINEPVTDSFKLFYDFAKHSGEVIKAVNENHLVSIGTVGGVGDKFGGFFSVFRRSNFEKLYSLPSLDAISLHDYSYDSGIFERLDIYSRLMERRNLSQLLGKTDNLLNALSNKIDNYYLKKGKLVHIPLTLRHLWNGYNRKNLEFALKISKPVYIGEVGFKSALKRERTKIFELDAGKKFTQGVGGYVLWLFEACGWNRDGHGYGFNEKDGFGEVVKRLKDDFEIEL
ncbi:MAG: cellulase family glycosylhydrolase [Ignavibacteria bacterium]|nr:cellulase family glycosylhydrolase [Ignavibacteria bacterium]